MGSFDKYLEEKLKNPEFKKEYDALEPEYNIMLALLKARKSQNLTQKELSERTGITQADISRIENGTRNPSLAMLKRLAEGLGMQLKLEFLPMSQKS
jgi:ribosome-binding protein aMBF1 (putative translation factor)